MREIIRYGKPKHKKWNKPVGYWAMTNDKGMARQMRVNIPFAEEIEAHPFDDFYGLGQGPSVWEIALKEASSIFKERETRKLEEAKAAAEAARAATIPTGGGGMSWPWLVGLGGVGLLAVVLLMRREER